MKNFYQMMKNLIKDPILVGFIVLIIIHIVYVYSTRFERTITIKERREFSTGGKYIKNTILDENGNVYQVAFSIPLLHFKDAETWLRLETNMKFTVSGYGMRIPILGLYPNIVSIV